jgi:hypothetical protein
MSMKVTFLGKESGDKGCPSLYSTDRDTVLIQGWRVVDAEALAGMEIPDHETVVEVPRALLRFAPQGT